MSRFSVVLVALLSMTAACVPTGAPSAPSAGNPTGSSGSVAPRSGGTLVVGTATQIRLTALDMVRSTAGFDDMFGSQVYEMLYRAKPDGGVPEDWLAQKTDVSSDGLTWTIHLRKGVKFQDGTDFDAAAVKDNLVRRQKIGTFPYQKQIQAIKEINVVDPDTLQLVLSHPIGVLRAMLSTPPFGMQSPTAMAKYPDPNEYPYHAAGTGPFKLDKLSDAELSLVRFDGYWGDRAYLDRLVFRHIPDISARELAVEAGDVQVADALSPSQITQLSNNAKVEVVRSAPSGAQAITFNLRKGPLSDLRVRQAIVYGIDLKAMLPVFGPLAQLPKSLVPSINFGQTDEPIYPYDPAKAKQLLAEAGVKPGTPLQLYPGDGVAEDVQAAQLIKQELDALGFQVTIQALDFNGWYAAVTTPAAQSKWDITVQPIGVIGYPDAEQWFVKFFSQADVPPTCCNFASYNNPQFEALLAKELTLTDSAARQSALAQLSHMMWGVVYYYPVAWTSSADVISKRVEGFVMSAVGSLDYHSVWLSQ